MTHFEISDINNIIKKAIKNLIAFKNISWENKLIFFIFFYK
jgi:hypothetical protein